jgi:hypothetical protein
MTKINEHCDNKENVCIHMNATLNNEFTCTLKLLFAVVGFHVLTAVTIKSAIFWAVTPCSPLEIHRHFRGTCLLHLQC